MAQDVVINGTTYPAVESVALIDANGNVMQFYPDAVRYVEQSLTPEQQAQAKKNIGVSTVSVMDYGAKGDGSTDDTAAFQTALAENRVLIVPGGDYVLSDTLVIRSNCCLELSQDTVLRITQTNKNAITMLRLANLKGNHATIFVPYAFSANVINCDGGEEYAQLDPDNIAATNATAVPPFKKWDPQWKMSRYVTDINICKPKYDGEHMSVDGACSGNAIYVHCDEAKRPGNFMWGVDMSGIRIAGAFNYGIRAYNKGTHVASWNHDMRIEAVIDGCKIGVSLENCYYARLQVSIQGRSAADGTVYAEHGIELRDSRGVDLSGSRVWDWNATNSLWASGNEYQHLALYGECRGLILDDFMYYEQHTYDIRDLIYTDRASNLEQMTILQEPITRWFKVKDGEPYYSNGLTEKRLITEEQLDAHFDTDIVKGFKDVLATATDENGSVLNGVGYTNGYLSGRGALAASDYYVTTGFIPCAVGQTMYVEGMSYASYDGNCTLCLYDADKKFVNTVSAANLVTGTVWHVGYEATENGFIATPNNVLDNKNVAYIRFTVEKARCSDYPMIAIDEEIKYTVEGFLADGIRVNAKNIVGAIPGGGTVTDEQIADAVADYLEENPIEVPEGGANIDVTATVGQTIVVEEVDANGKPTKWKSADYQPRTHWTEETVILPETTVEIDPDMGVGFIPNNFTVEGGKKYTIKYNGVDYADCECLAVEGQFLFGNLSVLDEAFPVTDHPFAIIYTEVGEDDSGEPIMAWACFAIDGSATVTLSITEVQHTSIPVQYVSNAFPYYVKVYQTIGKTAGSESDYSCSETVSNLEAIYKSGRSIALILEQTDVDNEIVYNHYYQPVIVMSSSDSPKLLFVFSKAISVNQTEVLYATPQEDGTYTISDSL